MCISPKVLPNKNFGSGIYKDNLNRFYKDVSSRYITVPCGVCRECIANKQMQLVQRVQMEALDHYIFFNTLTYNNEMLPKLTVSSGVILPYADLKDFQNMVKLIRKYKKFGARDFKYLLVSEKGDKKGRPHFHVLWFIQKLDGDNEYTPFNLQEEYYKTIKDSWCRNIGSTTKPIYKPLFTFAHKHVNGKYYANYDFHYVRPFLGSDGSDDVGFYVTKYVLKPSDKVTRLQQALKLNLHPDTYEFVWKIIKPIRTASKDFGDSKSSHVQAYVKSCLDKPSDVPYPVFFNPSTGQRFPLARFYRNKFLTLDYADSLYEKYPLPEGNIRLNDVRNINNLRDVDLQLTKVQEQVFGKKDIIDMFE